ncbi:hypothetical protein [Flavobacterium davisii]|uniref:Lipoprotein n=1 Tax=Flavobacterium columnare TaxID=996 RepID=A0A8G0P4N0_9FLAO|nr:hypothetical protein [Flavobacterium davisii]QYS89025.1 hypothetical protein JJC05_00810 [Flavobacterium davisii]
MKKSSIINLVLVATITAACGKKRKNGKEEELEEKFIYVQILQQFILKANSLNIPIMLLELIVYQEAQVNIQDELVIIQMAYIIAQM